MLGHALREGLTISGSFQYRPVQGGTILRIRVSIAPVGICGLLVGHAMAILDADHRPDIALP